MAFAYIGVGSNLNHPVTQITHAIQMLHHLQGIKLQAASSLYKTKPIGCPPQPDFVNAVVSLNTTLSAHDLLIALQGLEKQQGRVHSGVKNQPRSLDLDLLLYDEVILNTPELTLPHPRLYERNFVLIPLLEIAPDLPPPAGERSLAEIVARLSQNPAQVVELL